jgi:hypothetical protein
MSNPVHILAIAGSLRRDQSRAIGKDRSGATTRLRLTAMLADATKQFVRSSRSSFKKLTTNWLSRW